MEDEAKRHSPVRSTLEVLAAQHAIEHCHGEVRGPCC